MPKQQTYGKVEAKPVKSFFVNMITRDIPLQDAILDLLDNCVDGVLRTISADKRKTDKPYDGFSAEISISSDSFCISDNCGGIPWDLHKYAFTMGRDKDRPKDVDGSVGVYGIGMKRAIFKIGKECLITTKHNREEYEIEITADWIAEEDNWNLTANPARTSIKRPGTEILIENLNLGISERFGDESFILSFRPLSH